MLRFDNVGKTYLKSGFTLSGIDLCISAGEFVFITGKTGAGKSTLLKMIYGEEKPDEGSLFLSDVEIPKAKERDLQSIRRKIGLIFQESSLMDDINVYENTAYPLYIKRLDRQTVHKRVNIALRLVGLVAKRTAYPGELSGGEKQKACIARAVAADPYLIIADEPTGNIDRKAAFEIMDLLRRINEKGTTILVATHDMDSVSRFGSRVINISDGRILADMKRDG